MTPDASEPTTVPLAGWESHFADGEGFRASDDRELQYIALSVGEVGELMSGWDSGAWVDLEPGGLRCIVLRR
ncbi:hypothetical protein ACIRLA_01080 [Streptomyces sp. NPDC102364]|uniref:hypothetical protein n=1 Tax=Streptomyces sp. NPDC102364 TaxID=3366161 RepID=UPI003817F2B5